MKTRFILLLTCSFLFGMEKNYPEIIEIAVQEHKYVPSEFNRLIIYQVMVESFQDGDPDRNYGQGYGTSHHCGDLRGIIEALPYIKSLNVNALWVTPVFDSEKGTPRYNPDFPPDIKLDATGYFPRNYFRIDPNFGTLADAREMVDKAHELGLYVIFDGVFGHNKGNVLPSPRGNQPFGKSTQVDFPESLEFAREVVTYWIDELNIDGWRLDQAYQIPVENLYKLQKTVTDHCAKRKAAGMKWGTLGYVVGEIFDVFQKIQIYGYGTNENPGLVSNFNFPLRYRMVQCLAGEEKGLRIPDTKVLFEGFETHWVYPDFSVPNLMLTNHDLVRFGDLIQRNGLENPDHSHYWRRHRCAFAFMAAYTGPITLYYGDEIGEELEGFADKIDDPAAECWNSGLCDDHVSRTSGRIDNFSREEQALKDYVADLMKFRGEHEALYNGEAVNLMAGGNLYADLKYTDKEKILFVMNIGPGENWIEIPVEILKCQRLADAFSPKIIEPQQDIFKISVDALETGFYVCQ
ncbi:MAG: glycosidase [Candidatus Marinimicrobia bacterium]|nr:glycosidase [Candidatus Neomarinimicrobiota bacterium]